MAVKPTFFRRFKGVIQLVGSPSEGERHSAADKAFEMCEAESISLQEALEGIFSGGASNDAELQEKIEELERDNSMMAGELRRMREQSDGGDAVLDQGYKAALRKIWSFPHTRIAGGLCVIVVIFVEATYLTAFEMKTMKQVFMASCVVLSNLYMFGLFFFDWISAEDRRNGSGVVFIKGLTIIGGIVLSVNAFFGTLAINDWPGRPTNLFGAVAVVILTSILSMSNAVPLLVKKLMNSEGQPFKTLRAWFA
jgi:hypothetical protein